jgi:hypothetical protein
MNFTYLVDTGKYTKDMLDPEQKRFIEGMENAEGLIEGFLNWMPDYYDLDPDYVLDKIRLDCMNETMELFKMYLHGETCEGIVVWADQNATLRESKKAMLSQPMAGLTKEEIVATRERAIAKLEELGYEVVNTLFTDEWYSEKSMEGRGVVQKPMCFLAKSLENMSKCHAAYFCKGWENARGCKIEHDAAVAYGLTVIEEE